MIDEYVEYALFPEHAQDMATGRCFYVFPLGDTLSLVDFEHPANPVVMVRLADLLLGERFREVASTPETDYLTPAPDSPAGMLS